MRPRPDPIVGVMLALPRSRPGCEAIGLGTLVDLLNREVIVITGGVAD